ncbi:hydroxypyruvate isomerase [Arsenicitalea aurantiaca]|uniref:Hydroxypyruvate isomerase n=1 Tax=Arsenicitalea aurantiaca TaxID=1783274 RepID=A0A433XFD9_9HYPH|nr:2-oxo-tetronate isomerase [Arsenicitalea aurantiaca]RUT32821.1 hydroxypyruvate isomerase [Arsenicitalea aurantiaca]
MPRLAANLTMMFNEVPFLERFAAAAAAGFDAVEFLFPYDFPTDEVSRARADAGVEVVLFNMPPGDWSKGERGIAVFPDRVGEWRGYLDKALDYAQVLAVPRLHMMAGIAPSTDASARAAYRDRLAEAADRLGEAGLDLLIEPLNRRDMPGYLLDDFGMAADLIADLARPNLKLQFDIYHRQILHGDVTRALEATLPITGHVQLASVPLRNEPGTGELDDFAILRTLDRLGYTGHVGLEYRPAGDTVAGLSWRERL